VETGPAGLLAMLWIFAAAAWALVRKIRAGDPLAAGGLAALVALAVIAQAHDVFYDTKVMYALWLALGVALSPRPSLQHADESIEPQVEGDAQRKQDQERRHQQPGHGGAPSLDEAAQRRKQLE